MAKYSEKDRVILHPNITGQYFKYENRIGIILGIEAEDDCELDEILILVGVDNETQF